jgi:hypothetical protein
MRGLLIVLMMEAVSTSETSVNFYQTTRRNIPEDSFHIRRRENLKSHHLAVVYKMWYCSALFCHLIDLCCCGRLKRHS